MRKVIILAACVSALLVGSLRVGADTLDRHAGHHSARSANPFVKKEVFVDLPQLGQISDIVLEQGASRLSARILICGNRGAVIFDRGISASVEFSPPGHKAACLRSTSASQQSGFFNQLPPFVVYDRSGQEQWTFETFNEISEMAFGDVDGDGKPEFVVIKKSIQSSFGSEVGRSRGEIVLLSNAGKQLWRHPYDDVWHVVVADVDNDGKTEILVSNYSGRVVVKDYSGATKFDIVGYDARNFSLINWPTRLSLPHLLFSAGENVWVVKLTGEVVAKFNAPGAHSFELRGTIVQLQDKDPPYFAVIVKERAASASAILFIFDLDGRLLYQETLPVLFPVLATPIVGQGRSESLLVGGQGIIWKFGLK